MHRFGDIETSWKRLTPVEGYRNVSLVPLDKALEPLHNRITNLADNIRTAKKRCHYPSEHGLTREESAAIYIYTMEWSGTTLYRVLNRALRDEDRQALTIWFSYLKLFMSALEKLPIVNETLWRGIPGGMGANFSRDQLLIWWSMSSCSTSVKVIKDFLGHDDRSTVFLIQASNGRAIAKYSEIKNEEEVILPMGTQLRVKGDPLLQPGRQDLVHLIEIGAGETMVPTVSGVHPPTATGVSDASTPKYQKWKQSATTAAGGNGAGQELNQLYYPSGIVVDQDKSVLIADFGNGQIVRWNAQANRGSVVVGRNADGKRRMPLDHPTDVLVDQRNRSIIIADYGNRRVLRCSDHNGSDPQVLVKNINCWGLAMDKEGALYASDKTTNEVRRWKQGETTGTLVAGGNGPGSRLNQLHEPRFLFVDEDLSVYVSDVANHRVVRWRRGASEGVVVAGGNGSGTKLNQLSQPAGVLVDRWGQIYVADMGNHRVIRHREGESEGEIVIGGNGEGRKANQLSAPTGLSFDNEGNLYVADWGNHRAQRFDLMTTNKEGCTVS